MASWQTCTHPCRLRLGLQHMWAKTLCDPAGTWEDGGHLPLVFLPPPEGCHQIVSHHLPDSDEVWGFLHHSPQNRATEYKTTSLPSRFGSPVMGFPTTQVAATSPFSVILFGVWVRTQGAGTFGFFLFAICGKINVSHVSSPASSVRPCPWPCLVCVKLNGSK